jgi:hypothetical protein
MLDEDPKTGSSSKERFGGVPKAQGGVYLMARGISEVVAANLLDWPELPMQEATQESSRIPP